MTGKIGIVKYAWVCAYATLNDKGKESNHGMKRLWENLRQCLRTLQKERILALGERNEKVGNREVGGVVGKWRVDRVNKNGQYGVNVCTERGLFLVNTFQHKFIHRCMWARGELRSEIDSVGVDMRLRQDVVVAKVVRGMLNGSAFFFMVVAKIKMNGN